LPKEIFIPKNKTKFMCQNCGYSTAKWLGRCPECGGWDTLCEELITDNQAKNIWLLSKEKIKPKTIICVAQKKS